MSSSSSQQAVDYTEYVWKEIQDKCVMDENYELAQKIKEHLE